MLTLLILTIQKERKNITVSNFICLFSRPVYELKEKLFFIMYIVYILIRFAREKGTKAAYVERIMIPIN